MRFRLLPLLVLTSGALQAQAPQPAEPAASPTPSPTPQIDIPLAIGQEVKEIRLPQFDNQGKMTMRLNADVAERANETSFNFKGLRIEVFEAEKEKPRLEVLLSEAVFDRTTRLLTSNSRSIVKGEDFEIIGERLEFDAETRASRMAGPVSMTIIESDSPLKE